MSNGTSNGAFTTQQLATMRQLALLERFINLIPDGNDQVDENGNSLMRVLDNTRTRLLSGVRIHSWIRNVTLTAMNSLINNENDRYQIFMELMEVWQNYE